ncbi:hypothetical protein AB1L12_19795 [Peribacillus frigoritolerans]
MENKMYIVILTAVMTLAAISAAFFAYQSYQLELIKIISESK